MLFFLTFAPPVFGMMPFQRFCAILKNMKKQNVIKPKRTLALILLAALFLTGLYHRYKPLPENLAFRSPALDMDAGGIDFLYDVSYRDGQGRLIREQEIFDRVLQRIREARRYILLDMFLFNSWTGRAAAPYRRLSSELTEALITQKKAYPRLKIDFITDPINTVYGGARAPELERLGRAGVNIIVTDLAPLRDSNPLYSAFWRLGPEWLGHLLSRPRWLKHPFSATGQKVGPAGYLALLNFKANHRKVFLADGQTGYTCLILSANPHDASSAHSNVAVEIDGSELGRAIYTSEAAVAALSGSALQAMDKLDTGSRTTAGSTARVRLITEGAVKDALLAAMDASGPGQKIRLALFYLSDRDIIKALLAAHARGASVSIILDPNKDAFGYTKNGIPNRPVAGELIDRSGGGIRIRWYATSGEQFHPKLTLVETKERLYMITGSANLTRRNLSNFNLESDVLITVDRDAGVAREALAYFDRLWTNRDDHVYTLDYQAFADDSRVKYLVYRLQEKLGLSSF